MDIKERTLLITGSSGGLGSALIEGALSRGVSKIYTGYRKTPPATEIRDSRIIPLRLDVTSIEDIAYASSLAQDIDILINNAGINLKQSFIKEGQPEAAKKEMLVNYFGVMDMCKAFYPTLVKNQGCIINILSILARITLPAMGSLCASKAAALRLTETLQAESANKNVHVMAVLPGVMDTAMSSDFPGTKAAPALVAEAIYDGLICSATTLYPDIMAQTIAKKLINQRESIIAEFSSFI
ncbi:SDR family NAD(P)-dependent oxidoreductase [Pseudomonas sp. A014]|uniref:SDR family NAD(P)-dependent oxidoreductase n=1 Tax=Pseudomonas sp. A014 TaxID=3458058 RepID=UPI00403753F7